MYYGEEKRLQMMRSILPSAKRKEARSRTRALHQSNRAQIHAKLAPLKGPASRVVEVYEDRGEDLTFEWQVHNHEWDSIKFDRRMADKINHFVRWAEEITKGMPEGERYDYMRSMLPDNLIGRHALSHLSHFDVRNTYKYTRYSVSDEERARRATEYAEWKEAFIETARNAVALRLGKMNKHVKNNPCWWRDPTVVGWDEVLQARVRIPGELHSCYRVCNGIGDFDSFISDIFAGRDSRCRNGGHPSHTWGEALAVFLEMEWKGHGYRRR